MTVVNGIMQIIAIVVACFLMGVFLYQAAEHVRTDRQKSSKFLLLALVMLAIVFVVTFVPVKP